MDGGVARRPPLMRPSSNPKRTYSTMAASHRDESFPTRDEHHENEHAARRRRRFEAELRPARIRFPGDGLDFRRPAMSTSSVAATAGSAEESDDGDVNPRMDASAVIDLTTNDALQRPSAPSRRSTSPATHSDAARVWAANWGAESNVVDLEDSGEERNDGEAYDASNLPGASMLALPPRRVPSQRPGLRRRAHRRSPSAEMDDIQFIEQRTLAPPPQTIPSLPGTPRPQRNVTPYPLNETIDLTEDDDEGVMVDHAQRDGVNLTRPEGTAGAGTRSMADRGFQHVGQIVNLLREGGAQLGGRLYRRALDVAGPGALEEFEQQPQPVPTHHPSPLPPPRVPPHHRYHHHDHVPAPRNIHWARPYHPAFGAVGTQALGVQNDMAELIDYRMTAFEMETGRGNARPLTPKYEPPPPAAEGFTRSPAEFEIVVCPNCGDELARGDEGIKREVWVIKGCGHAYCGECAHNRMCTSGKKGRKGKAPVLDSAHPHLPEPFSKCVVPGCAKPAGRQSMIRVYLGS